jgi:hypothetical protein
VVHVLAHRADVGAALALIAGRDVGTGLPFHPGQEWIAPAGQEGAGAIGPRGGRQLGSVGGLEGILEDAILNEKY